MKIPGLYRLIHLDRTILRFIFGFDIWHVQKLSDRQYVQDIVNYVNQKHGNKKDIVEVGAGLGDIIRNIKIKNKLILDYDFKVLKACRFLSYFRNLKAKKTNFKVFDITKNSLQNKYDVIIIVNFIHEISPEILNPKLLKIWKTNLNNNGVLILDSARSHHHKYHHKFEEIKKESKKCDMLDKKIYDFNRKIHFYYK